MKRILIFNKLLESVTLFKTQRFGSSVSLIMSYSISKLTDFFSKDDFEFRQGGFKKCELRINK